MNLTDLTTELQARAGDSTPGPGPAVTRLSGVRHRIQVRRRRQAATAAGIAAVAVAAVVLAPGLSGIRADRTPPPASTTAPVPANPLAFAADTAGDPLVASEVGAPGQQDLVVRFTPTAANLAFSSYCRPSAPTQGDPDEDQAEVILSVNGHDFTWGGCNSSDGPNEDTVSRGDDPEKAEAAWRADGLKIGQESVFRLRVNKPRSGFDPAGTVRLGLGIYALSAPRVESSGVRLPTLMDSGGHRYRLKGYVTTDVTADSRDLKLAVPAGRYPAQVQWGVTDPDAQQELKGDAQLLIDGHPGPTSADIGVVVSDELPDAGAHQVRLQVDKKARGTMQIAYYVRTD